MDPRDFCSFIESHGFVAGGEDNCTQEYILFAFCHDIDVNVPECVGLFLWVYLFCFLIVFLS